jgi:hypothetical protein
VKDHDAAAMSAPIMFFVKEFGVAGRENDLANRDTRIWPRMEEFARHMAQWGRETKTNTALGGATVAQFVEDFVADLMPSLML